MRLILVSFIFVYLLNGNTEFKEVLRVSLQTHPSIKMSLQMIKGADNGIEIAKWGYYPTPSVEVSKSDRNSIITARLEQPLWTGGKLDAEYDMAILKKEEALITLNENRYKLIENILGILQIYLQATAQKEAIVDGKNQLEKFAKMLDRRLVAGVSSQSDKELLDARIAQINSDLLSVEAKQRVAIMQFELISSTKINQLNFMDELTDSNHIIERQIAEMLFFSPILKKQSLQIKSANIDIIKAEASLWPTVVARVENTTGSIYDKDNKTSDKFFYVTLHASTGAGLSLLSNIESTKIKVQQLNFEKLTKEKELIDNFSNDYTNMLSTKNKISTMESTIVLSQNVLESYERLFLVGKKQWLDLVNSSRELMQAKIALSDTKVIYKISKYRLGLKTGRIDLVTGEIR